jgi:hypothetical protein
MCHRTKQGKKEMIKEETKAMEIIGNLIYKQILQDMDISEEDLKQAIRDGSLSITNVDVLENEDGSANMTFDANIKEK